MYGNNNKETRTLLHSPKNGLDQHIVILLCIVHPWQQLLVNNRLKYFLVKGPYTLTENECESEIFPSYLPLLDVNNKLDFLRTSIEATSVSRSLSLSVNVP